MSGDALARHRVAVTGNEMPRTGPASLGIEGLNTSSPQCPQSSLDSQRVVGSTKVLILQIRRRSCRRAVVLAHVCVCVFRRAGHSLCCAALARHHLLVAPQCSCCALRVLCVLCVRVRSQCAYLCTCKCVCVCVFVECVFCVCVAPKTRTSSSLTARLSSTPS